MRELIGWRRLLGVASVLAIAACSETPPAGTGPAPAYNGAGGPGYGAGAVVPGSQQDLAATAGDRVFFPYDQSNLTGEAQQILRKQSDWLRRYPNVRVTIEGDCDERGTREYNLALGERRAQAVKNYLVAVGVSAGRITTISYGKERPEVVGSSEEAYAQNRRGVTTVQ